MNLPDDPFLIKEPLPGAGEPETHLEWERWHLREDPRRWLKLLLLAIVVLLVGVVLVVSLPLTAAIALGLALVVTLLPYLLPRRFVVENSGVSIHQGFYSTRRAWAEIESYKKITQGYLLQLRPKEGSKPPRPNLLTPNTRELFLPSPLEIEKQTSLKDLLSRHIPTNF